jgi:hypothetical protein
LESVDSRFGPIGAILRWAVAIAALVGSGTTTAQTAFQLDGTVNLNYNVTTPIVTESPEFFVELRPGITFQTGSPKLVFRVAYLFAGSLGLDGSWSNNYSNQLSASLAAQPDGRSTITVGGILIQGDTAFQLSQRAADTGQPAFRPPGSPAQVTGTLTQTFLWEADPELRLEEGLTAMVVAPQYALDQSNSSVTGRLTLDHIGSTNSFGGEFLSTVARLRQSTVEAEPFWSAITSLLGLWNHDFDQGWSGAIRAGVASVVTFTDTNPKAFVPSGNLTARYLGRDAGVGLHLDYGPMMDLQTGTIAQNARATVHGYVNFDALWPRQLSGSAGFLHAWPIGAVTPGSAYGIGDALQGDLGFLWGFTESFYATARYSVAYQFNQPEGVAASLIHVFLIGVTARYGNAALPPMPSAGERVDGGDRVPFPGTPAPRQ